MIHSLSVVRRDRVGPPLVAVVHPAGWGRVVVEGSDPLADRAIEVEGLATAPRRAALVAALDRVGAVALLLPIGGCHTLDVAWCIGAAAARGVAVFDVTREGWIAQVWPDDVHRVGDWQTLLATLDHPGVPDAPA